MRSGHHYRLTERVIHKYSQMIVVALRKRQAEVYPMSVRIGLRSQSRQPGKKWLNRRSMAVPVK